MSDNELVFQVNAKEFVTPKIVAAYHDPMFIGRIKKREYWVYHYTDMIGLQLAKNNMNLWWVTYGHRRSPNMYSVFTIVKHRRGINIVDASGNWDRQLKWTMAYVMSRDGELPNKAETITAPIAIDTAVARFLEEFDKASNKKKLGMIEQVDKVLNYAKLLEELKKKYIEKYRRVI